MRKVVTRLMPALLVLYVIAYLDRVNVTFAQDRLEEDLGFSGAVYGFGAGIFFIGYFLLEVPSNLALHRFGARKWMARIMITWGLISACTMFVPGPAELLRRALPARHRRGRLLPGHDPLPVATGSRPASAPARSASSCRAIAISYAIGAPISGGIMSVFGGVAGLEDWQWLFIIEAIPAIVAGVLVFFKLPDGPQDAGWLEPEEKRWLADASRARSSSASRASATRSARCSRTAASWSSRSCTSRWSSTSTGSRSGSARSSTRSTASATSPRAS